MRRRLPFWSLVVISTALLLSLLPSVTAAEQKPLLFLGDKDYPPMAYLEAGEALGMDVDVVRALSKPLGREVQIQLMDWNEAQEKVIKGEADGVLEMSVSEERQRFFDFAAPTFTREFRIFVRTDDMTIQNVADLEGRRVGVTSGGFPRRHLESHTNVNLVLIENYKDGFERLKGGAIDAVVADSWVAAYTLSHNGITGITPAGKPIAINHAAFAVKKGNDALVAQLNQALQTLKQDGTLSQIQQKWRPEEIIFVTRQHVQYVITLAAVITLAIICGGMALWIIALKRQVRLRKETELALRESEQRYRALTENAPNGIVVSVDDILVYSNSTALTIIGAKDPSEVIGHSIWEFVQRPDWDLAKGRRTNLLKTGHAAPLVEFKLRRVDGVIIDARTGGVAVSYSGKPAILNTLVDVTEQRRIRERENWRTRILEAMTAGGPLRTILELITRSIEAEDTQGRCSILILDENGKHLLVGAAPGLPEAFNAAIHGVEIGDHVGTCGVAAFTGKRVFTEDVLIDPNWEKYRELAELAKVRACWSEPIISSSGHVLGTFATYHVVPGIPSEDQIQLMKHASSLASLALERKQAEEAVHRSEVRYRTLFESAQDAIFMMRGQLFLDCNPYTLKMFGCTLDQIKGQTPMRFSPELQPDGRDSMTKAKERIQAAIWGAPQLFEWRHCRYDGTEFDAEVSLNRVDLDEEPLLLAVVRDITQRKRAERRVQQSREQLRALSARLQSLREQERIRIAREIHDHLGQLLTALSLDLRMIERKVANVADAELRAALSSKLTSVCDITNETITSVQKIASELRPAILDRLGLEPAIEAELQAFQDRTGIQCECSLPRDAALLSLDMATAFFRIFQEILTNVARHAQATRVKVRLHRDTAGIILAVEDNGVGMHDTDLENPKSLGLLGMRERAEMLGGQITFAGSSGKGTIVTVSLPLTDQKSEPIYETNSHRG